VRAVSAGSVGYIGALATIVSTMIDLRVRPRLQWVIQPIGRGLAGMGVTPQLLTFIGLLVTVGGGVLLGFGWLRAGAGVALAGSILDGLDGSVARAAGKDSPRGALLDAVSDRVGEIACFAGLAVAMTGNTPVLLLIVLALGGSMLVPYLRAKAEAAGLDGRGGLMGRAERVLLFTIGLLIGLVEPMLWVMVVATWSTVAWRFFETYRQLTP
jgi:CDP-diacylglycerol---glycerol-3-phosphate 3-phosphatidyltransferase